MEFSLFVAAVLAFALVAIAKLVLGSDKNQ
jgi:hypothetical protein